MLESLKSWPLLLFDNITSLSGSSKSNLNSHLFKIDLIVVFYRIPFILSFLIRSSNFANGYVNVVFLDFSIGGQPRNFLNLRVASTQVRIPFSQLYWNAWNWICCILFCFVLFWIRIGRVMISFFSLNRVLNWLCIWGHGEDKVEICGLILLVLLKLP